MPSASSASFSDIFQNACIPHPIHGIDDIAAAYSPAEIAQLGKLADELIEDISKGAPVRVYFDNDGTLFRFHPDPTQTRMDEKCFEGLVRLAKYENFLATSLTGRDVHEAANFMLTPGYPVRDTHGQTLVAEGDKTLRFAITGSHGVENLDLQGNVTRYDFNKLTPRDGGVKANEFIASFQQEAVQLRAKYPGIHVEDGKHGAVGINVRTIDGDMETKGRAYQEALALLQKYEASEDNPTHPATGQTVFRIKREGSEELELRPVGFGKDFGILEFGKPDKAVHTLFIGDSFKKPDGTDIDAARLVNDKSQFDRGSVLVVRNGRFDPETEGGCDARAIFANPTVLGRFLCHVAEQVEQRRPLLDRTAAPAATPSQP